MTKKLFYSLATFVMSLLLVVGASACSGSRGTDPTDGTDYRTTGEDTTGINPDDAQYNERMINDYYLTGSGAAENYYRLPVVTSYKRTGAERDTVIAFFEERFRDNATGYNDVGVNGSTPVDIKYTLFYDNSGDSITVDNKLVGNDTSAESDVTKSKGAPYVFLDEINNKVTVYASSGGGFYGNSKISYTVGTINDSGITWTEWQDLTLLNNGNGIPANNKYGVWSGVGKKDSSENYYLPVSYVDDPAKAGGASKWGVLLLQSTDPSGNSWQKVAEKTWDGTQNSESKMLTGGANNTLLVRKKTPGQRVGFTSVSSGTTIGTLTDMSIKDGGWGSEFAAYYDSYNNRNKTYFINARGDFQNLTVAVFDGENLGASPSSSMKLADQGKAGSVTVLSDGSIVTVAEEGTRGSGSRNFEIYLRRFNSYYIQNHTEASKAGAIK